MTTQPTTRRVEATIARSWLLVNAARADTFDRAEHCDADQIVLDIEDALDPAHKPAARAAVAHWPTSPPPTASSAHNRAAGAGRGTGRGVAGRRAPRAPHRRRPGTRARHRATNDRAREKLTA
ncbi:hypothetical protein ACIBEK_31050 [Nocardia fusca]|uniref:hypothetical protein n=1 Tax=Nocardia fusca TaxID=941183 RepID=UPI00379A2B44